MGAAGTPSRTPRAMPHSIGSATERRHGLLEKHVARELARLGIGRGDVVLAAVSGGPDSSALLLVLSSTAASLGFSCQAAYFDHQIRGRDERAAELACVQRLAEATGVALHTGAAPVRSLAKEHGRSLEEEAREQRYRFLARTAEQCGVTLVATGHTADDQVETVLLHLLRGTGLLGLAGMRGRSTWPFGPGPNLLRPLLGLTRADTMAFASAHGLTPHQDSQNLSPRFLRNRVRSEVLPLLTSFNPRLRDALLRLSRAAAEQADLLQALADYEGESVGAPAPAMFDTAALSRLPAALSSELLARGFAAVSGSRRGLTARHLAALNGLLPSREERAIDLPAGVRARVSGTRLSFEPRSAATRAPAARPAEIPVPVPGRVRFGRWQFDTRPLPPGVPCSSGPLRAVLTASAAEAGLTLRTRRPGDRMRINGGHGHRKLQDVLVDAKVPRSERDELPLLCLPAGIVWVPAIRADERARVMDPSVPRVRVTAARLDAHAAGGLGSKELTE